MLSKNCVAKAIWTFVVSLLGFVSTSLAQPSSQTIPIQELTGTLTINARQDLGMKSLPGGPRESIKGAWVFVNGQLVSRVPIHRDFILPPGQYEIRLVAFSEHWPYFEYSFPNHIVSISKGMKTVVNLQLSDACCEKDSAKCCNQAIRLYQFHQIELNGFTMGYVNPFYNNLPDDFGQTLQLKIPALWDAFLHSEEWKPVQRAYESLRTGARPSKPQIWVDLPGSLGGAREFDREQLEFLATWLALRWGDAVGREIFKLPRTPRHRELTEEEFRQRLQPFYPFVVERKEWIKSVLGEVIQFVEQAPKQD